MLIQFSAHCKQSFTISYYVGNGEIVNKVVISDTALLLKFTDNYFDFKRKVYGRYHCKLFT